MNREKITFFSRFEADIVSGKKTITIRDKSESYFQPNQELAVFTNETDRFFANIKVLSVTPIQYDELSEQHAQQENMSLTELKEVIREIYSNNDSFFVIHFKLI
ncbi:MULTISPECIES: N(4)-acetylcytidine aminohydrolase [unclassified Mannheimia]|uniref:N(4)-acetylcytidine aminohydrolase n=1 Tax=unclassified Mannheimia TaxID=2645054 RepID=UPI00359E0B03